MPWGADTCRICSGRSPACRPINDAPASTALATQIHKFLKIEVFHNDLKPQQVCEACCTKLDDFEQFYTICQENEAKFDAILLERPQWGYPTENNHQKMSVIVSAKPLLDMDLYKEAAPPFENCINDQEMLDIAAGSYEGYISPTYIKKIPEDDFYQESVLRHSSDYQVEAPPSDNIAINYSCHQEVPPAGAACLSYASDYSYDRAAPAPSYAFQQPPCKPKAPSVPKKTFGCPHCDKIFKRRVTLNAHIAIHTKIRPYICDICNKTYAIKCDLTNHLKVHTDLYECQLCHRSFVAPSKLQRHLRTHTKDKPFICDFKNCAKSFSDKRNLDGHKILHCDVFDYRCDTCGKAFRTKNRLKQHGKAHIVTETLFKCNFCVKAYKYKSTLVSHLKKHNGYVCQYCDKNCEQAAKLIRHKRVCEMRNR